MTESAARAEVPGQPLRADGSVEPAGQSVTTPPDRRSLRLAMSTSLASAVLVPLVGLATAPILAHAVGATGRGEVSAAIAPNVLILSIATIGLPDALTFQIAQHPHRARRALVVAVAFEIGLGLLLAGVTLPALGFFSGGDHDLARITLIATLIAVPALVFDAFRGVAAAHQMWFRLAIGRVIGAFTRLIAMGVLALVDRLTVEVAVLVICLAPFVAGLVYLPLFRKNAILRVRPAVRDREPVAMPLLGYGLRGWVGSIAGILLSKLGVLLFTPLSNPEQLGLYVVAITISDLPVVLAMAVKDALFGVNARSRDAQSFAAVCRGSVLVGVIGSLLIALSLPLWVGVVFGAEFEAAIPTTWILIGCAIMNVPTFILAAGVGAWGRPGLRSIGLLFTLVLDVVVFVLLVPHHGAVGAAGANLVSATFGAVFSVIGTSRVIGVRIRDLILPRRTDVAAAAVAGRSMLRRMRIGR